ncbi:hypothetical protein P3X46_015099 [Hevea brasiliensis]|uniref:Protein kinase domain-containing protein n=1 Tax=Hevea brasiliensis TaxID=3981 RepID=A0ABQ9LUU6_HEVBR|nr:hypothetical protein P3X46_015099 [Hevea brasiliensis]
MNQKINQSKQIAMVVLEGIKVSTKDTGVAPLCRAMRDVVNPDDEIIVLALLPVNNTSELLSIAGGGEGRQCNQSLEADPRIRFLQEEISQRKEVYLRVFRPFYNRCKTNGVKFQVKIASGFLPKDIIIEEANNVRATWIVMDRCFARHLTFRLSRTDCNLSLVSDDEEATVNCLPANEAPEGSTARDIAGNPKFPNLRNGSISVQIVSDCNSLPAVNSECQPCSPFLPKSICKESENQTISEPEPCGESESPKGAISPETICVQRSKQDTMSTKINFLLGQPLQLTWEVILEITQGFKSRIWNGLNRNYTTYYGYMEDDQSIVLVKRFNGNSGSILEAEMNASLFLHHKNILSMIGYHRSEHEIVLVFPVATEGTLDRHISDLSRQPWGLTFEDKLKIAIETAQGIRYMHEECPRGPIAHSQIHPSNIFLRSDLQPMISGFEHATWLQLKREYPAFANRYQLEDYLDHGSIVLIKSDILSFGVLLLRLFCRRSVPQDDTIMIEWARPLLLDRAFHLLVEEDSDDLDMHAIFRVMSAARMCTMSKPISRPSISEEKIFVLYNHLHQRAVHKRE